MVKKIAFVFRGVSLRALLPRVGKRGDVSLMKFDNLARAALFITALTVPDREQQMAVCSEKHTEPLVLQFAPLKIIHVRRAIAVLQLGDKGFDLSFDSGKLGIQKVTMAGDADD